MNVSPLTIDFDALELEIAEAKDAGDRNRAAQLQSVLWLDLHHRIATRPDPHADIIEGLRVKQTQVRDGLNRRRRRIG